MNNWPQIILELFIITEWKWTGLDFFGGELLTDTQNRLKLISHTCACAHTHTQNWYGNTENRLDHLHYNKNNYLLNSLSTLPVLQVLTHFETSQTNVVKSSVIC